MKIKPVWRGWPISQKQAVSIVKSNHRMNLWSGSIRSGKTFASIFRWFMFLSYPPSGGQLIMVGRTRDSLYRNVIQPMQDPELFGDLADQVKYTPGAPQAKILGRTVHIMGASDVNAEKTIRGLTLAGAYIDELTILVKEFFKQLLGRMNVDNAQCFATTNPDSPYHWLKAEFMDRLEELNDNPEGRLDDLAGEWIVFNFILDDNPSLSDHYKRSIKKEYVGLWYKRFILGHWVSAEGSVFDMWDDDKHVTPWDELPSIVEWLGVGIDHGTTNPTSAILLGIGDDGVIYAVDEWRYEPSNTSARLTNAELSARIRKWIMGEHHPTSVLPLDDLPVIIDPAAAGFHVQMRSDGTPTFPASNQVVYGIQVLSSLLGSGRMKVSSKCEGLIKEIPGYAWDPKATDDGEDQVIKKNDHSVDSLRYACITTERRWRDSLDLVAA